MHRFFKQLSALRRTFQVNILSLFLTLIITSFTVVGFLTYYKHGTSIDRLSKSEISRVSDSVLDETHHFVADTRRTVSIASSFFNDLTQISPANQPLVDFLLSVVKFAPSISNFYIGTEEGSFLGAFNMRTTVQKFYLTDPQKPIPTDTVFALRWVNRGEGATSDTWYYKDKDFQTLGQETIKKAPIYDPRSRPWYQTKGGEHRFYWTDVYQFNPTNELGISLSSPLVTAQGKVMGVVGADLSFILLSEFLASQQVGKDGKIFLIDEQGKRVLPQEGSSYDQVLATAYRVFQEKKQHDFIFANETSDEEIEYIADFEKVHAFEKEWWVAIIVPVSDYFGELVHTQNIILTATLIVLVFSALIIYFFAKKVSAPIVTLASEVDKIRQFELSHAIQVHSNIKEIDMMARAIHSLRQGVASFARYVPKEVVKKLIQSGREIRLGGEKRELTIFFSDIANFTTLTEEQPPEEFLPLLAHYFDGLSKIILKEEGTIDKYIGDSIMAFWGAPLSIPNHAEKACLAALACKAYLCTFNAEQQKAGKPTLPTRFGITTGTVVVGNFGTSERMNYTVLGDAANAAARLESTNKNYHTEILISEEVVKQLPSSFLTRPLDEVTVKGKHQTIRIYELMGMKEGATDLKASPEQIALAEGFTQAYRTWKEGRLPEAKALFEVLAKKYPDDYPTQLYLQK